MKIYLIILCCLCLGCRQSPNNKTQLKTNDNITVKTTKTVDITSNNEGKLVEEKGIFLGKVNGKTIRYDRSYTEFSIGQHVGGHICIYTKNKNKKIVLLDYNFEGYDFGNLELLNLLNHPFIYIAESARVGLYGKLYAVDLKRGKTNLVNYDEKLRFIDVETNPYKIQGLKCRNIRGIVVDSAKNITSEDYYRSDSDTTYTYKCKFKLLKIKHNTYTLKLTEANMIPNLY